MEAKMHKSSPSPAVFSSQSSAFPFSEIEQSISQRFEKITSLYPDNISVEEGGVKITYSQLNGTANQIARYISLYPQPADQPVAIFVQQGSQFLTTIVATLKTGAFYVPMDPSFPHARNKLILEASTAELLLTNDINMKAAREIAPDSCKVISVDAYDAAADRSNLGVKISPDAPAYLIFTSGSTGTPKGVLQNQRNMLHNTMTQTASYELKPTDKMTLCYSPSVMGCLRGSFNALLNGATLFPVDVKKNGLAFFRRILSSNNVTILHCVATLYRHIAESISSTEEFPHLRLVILGGEAAVSADIELFAASFPPDCKLCTGFGATETGTVCINYIRADDSNKPGNLPPGYAVPNMEMLILDEEGRIVPSGVEGELAVTSPYIALGYWRREELNKQVFVRRGAGLGVPTFLTGDIGKISSDGCLEIIGRKDFQIKIRGFRVDLSQLEMALQEHQSLKQVAVVGFKNLLGEMALAAFCVPVSSTPEHKELKRFLGSRVPSFMLPAAFFNLEALPQTPNGKIDRLRLSEMATIRPGNSHSSALAQTDLQKDLSRVWGQLLKVPEVGLNDNFFDLGGNSLLAARLADDMAKELGIEVPIAKIFTTPTVGELAESIKEKHMDTTLVPISPGGTKSPLFFINSIGYAKSILPHLEDKQQPIIGISIFGVTDRFEPPYSQLSIADIAQLVVRDIRSVQPSGPYKLVTFCGDGYLTLEVAAQLRLAGLEVSLLCLIDGLFQPYRPGVRSLIYTLKKIGPVLLTKILYKKIKNRFSSQRPDLNRFGEIEKAEILDSKVGRDTVFYEAYVKAKRSYQAAAYDGKNVILILSSEWRFANLEKLQKIFVNGFKCEEIVGFHNHLTDSPFVEGLAKKVSSYL